MAYLGADLAWTSLNYQDSTFNKPKKHCKNVLLYSIRPTLDPLRLVQFRVQGSGFRVWCVVRGLPKSKNRKSICYSLSVPLTHRYVVSMKGRVNAINDHDGSMKWASAMFHVWLGYCAIQSAWVKCVDLLSPVTPQVKEVHGSPKGSTTSEPCVANNRVYVYS